MDNTNGNVTGYIDLIENRITLQPSNHQVVPFVVNTNFGRTRVQIKVWDQEIDRLQPHLQLNNVIEIQGAVKRPIYNQAFNRGTEDFELFITRETRISTIGGIAFHMRH